MGTFTNMEGLKAKDECSICPEGFYCVGLGLTTPSGLCQAGHFCPPGSIHPDEGDCPKGHYCPEGCGAPLLCPSGGNAWRSAPI